MGNGTAIGIYSWLVYLFLLSYGSKIRLKLRHFKNGKSWASLFWLLFFPQATHIIIDLVALHYGLLSLLVDSKILDENFSLNYGNIFTLRAIILSSCGIFLGGVERFNSLIFFINSISLLK